MAARQPLAKWAKRTSTASSTTGLFRADPIPWQDTEKNNYLSEYYVPTVMPSKVLRTTAATKLTLASNAIEMPLCSFSGRALRNDWFLEGKRVP